MRKIQVFFVAVLFLLSAAIIRAQEKDAELLKARRAVWIAWFENDQSALKKLVPDDSVVCSTGEAGFKHQADVLKGAIDFHAAGGKLINLEFPKTEVQHFGDVAITWSEYVLELEVGGKRERTVGRATEIFVKRKGQWTNPGWHTDSENFTSPKPTS